MLLNLRKLEVCFQDQSRSRRVVNQVKYGRLFCQIHT